MSELSYKGAETLLEAHKLITGDRNTNYGHPLDDYTQTCNIFEALTGIRLTPLQGIMFMRAVKLSRIRTAADRGETHYDSIVDDMGYAGCYAIVATVTRVSNIRDIDVVGWVGT